MNSVFPSGTNPRHAAFFSSFTVYTLTLFENLLDLSMYSNTPSAGTFLVRNSQLRRLTRGNAVLVESGKLG